MTSISSQLARSRDDDLPMRAADGCVTNPRVVCQVVWKRVKYDPPPPRERPGGSRSRHAIERRHQTSRVARAGRPLASPAQPHPLSTRCKSIDSRIPRSGREPRWFRRLQRRNLASAAGARRAPPPYWAPQRDPASNRKIAPTAAQRTRARPTPRTSDRDAGEREREHQPHHRRSAECEHR